MMNDKALTGTLNHEAYFKENTQEDTVLND